jgi:hypothetical protein
MTALEQVAQLKQQAIELLLNEREQIDSELNQLGYGQENAPSGKRRGRRSKAVIEAEDLALAASHS